MCEKCEASILTHAQYEKMEKLVLTFFRNITPEQVNATVIELSKVGFTDDDFMSVAISSIDIDHDVSELEQFRAMYGGNTKTIITKPRKQTWRTKLGFPDYASHGRRLRRL